MAGIGTATERLDGPAKVTGRAHYGGTDVALHNPAYAVLVTSAIARGRIAGFDLSEARSVPGVIDIFTHQSIGKIEPGKTFDGGGYMGTSIAPMASAEIRHDGQIVAIACANSFEAAREAAHRVNVNYVEEKPSATFGSPGTETVAVAAVSKKHEDPKVGDFEKAFAQAAVKIDREYETGSPYGKRARTCMASRTAWRSSWASRRRRFTRSRPSWAAPLAPAARSHSEPPSWRWRRRRSAGRSS
jgi:xanthine dehydrogenase YagR molybdenum-binding subunit